MSLEAWNIHLDENNDDWRIRYDENRKGLAKDYSTFPTGMLINICMELGIRIINEDMKFIYCKWTTCIFLFQSF